MKKLRVFQMLVLVLVIAFLCASPAFAQARYGLHTSRPLESTGVFTDRDGNAMDYAVWIYGVKVYADAATSELGIYDCDTVQEIADGETAVDEIGEASQYDTAERYYPQPIFFSDGVTGVIATGVGFVIYGPEPE
jgi:hypothetical protein